MEEIKAEIQKLKELGLDDKKIVALINISIEEFFDEMQGDLMEASEEDLQRLESLTQNPNLNVNDLLKTIYGINSNSKLQNYILQSLKENVASALRIKEFITNAQQYDPEALKKIIDAQKDPNFNKAQETLKKAT